MNRFFVYLMILFTHSNLIVQAEIIQTVTISPIKEAIERANENALVVFDVDSVIDLKGKNGLVDSQLISIIKGAQSRGVKVVAITNYKVDSSPENALQQELFIKKLEDNGINFKASWEDVPNQKIDVWVPNNPPKDLIFKDGILFPDSIPRGKSLDAFFWKISSIWQKEFWEQQFYLPEFDHFPADLKLFEPAKNIDLSSHPLGRQYRTVLRDGFKMAIQKINNVSPSKEYEGRAESQIFAGHYCVITCGCGASCQMNWIVDLKTGIIIDFIHSNAGIEVYPRSRLFVRNTGGNLMGGLLRFLSHEGLLTDDFHEGLIYTDMPPSEVKFYELNENKISFNKQHKKETSIKQCRTEKCEGSYFYSKPKLLEELCINKREYDGRHKVPPHINTIIFIDSNPKNLDSVKEMCDQLHIGFVGFEYTIPEERLP